MVIGGVEIYILTFTFYNIIHQVSKQYVCLYVFSLFEFVSDFLSFFSK
jgi:hypothetical protein